MFAPSFYKLTRPPLLKFRTEIGGVDVNEYHKELLELIKDIRTDNLFIFSFFTVIAITLLVPLGYLAGSAGFIAASILLSIAMSFISVWANGVGRSFANGAGSKSRDKIEAVVVALVSLGYCAYLSFGLHYFITYLNTGITLKPLFYCWLISFSTPMLLLILIISCRAYPFITITNTKKQLKKERIKQEAYELATFELGKKYKMAMDTQSKVYGYIKLSEKVAKQYKDQGSLSFSFANYTAKLMIKYSKNTDYNLALTIFDSYVDFIVPSVGLSEKSSDVASMAIYISVMLDDSNIFNKTTEHILGKNMDILTINNNVLHFNLACYYALKQDKTNLLLFVSLARKQGKHAEEFLSDSDFIHYRNDEDFLYAVNTSY